MMVLMFALYPWSLTVTLEFRKKELLWRQKDKKRHNGKKTIKDNKRQQKTKEKEKNKLAKLGDAIAISQSETINDPLTDRGRC